MKNCDNYVTNVNWLFPERQDITLFRNLSVYFLLLHTHSSTQYARLVSDLFWCLRPHSHHQIFNLKSELLHFIRFFEWLFMSRSQNAIYIWYQNELTVMLKKKISALVDESREEAAVYHKAHHLTVSTVYERERVTSLGNLSTAQSMRRHSGRLAYNYMHHYSLM